MTIGLSTSNILTPRTVRDLINKAFRTAHILGKSEPADADEMQDAFDLLNGLIEQANLEKLFGLYQTEIVVPLVSGQVSYTLGPASASPPPTVETVRPVEILSAFSRRNGIDLPIAVTHQKVDYDRIQLKTVPIAGWEQLLYYQATFPAGTIFLYQVPLDNLTTVYLTVTASVSPFLALEDDVLMPPGYFHWLQYKLAQRLCPDYGLMFSQEALQILIETESALKANNIKPFPIAGNETALLSSHAQGGYNVYSDTTRR